MAVIVKIKERNPRHGILAIGTITIESLCKIKDAELVRSDSNKQYRVIFPSSGCRKMPLIEILDRELREKILDAFVAVYEKDVRYNRSGIRHDRLFDIEMSQINRHRKKRFKADY